MVNVPQKVPTSSYIHCPNQSLNQSSHIRGCSGVWPRSMWCWHGQRLPDGTSCNSLWFVEGYGATYCLFWRIANSTNLSILSKLSLLVGRGHRAWSQGSYSMLETFQLHAETTSSRKLRSLCEVTDNMLLVANPIIHQKKRHTHSLRASMSWKRQPAWTTRPA